MPDPEDKSEKAPAGPAPPEGGKPHDPKAVAHEQIILLGYLNKTARTGHVRVHQVPDFRVYVDIPNTDVLLIEVVDPNGPSRLAVVGMKHTAKTQMGIELKPDVSKSHDFATGRISDNYWKAATSINDRTLQNAYVSVYVSPLCEHSEH
jgi:hypothetical protein